MNEVVVISHPRSGLTWLRRMCHEAAKDMGDDGWLFHFSHDGMGLQRTTMNRLRQRFESPSVGHVYPRVAERRFVFLYRDPRDVIWSNWHQVADGESFYEFLRSPTHGIIPFVEWLLWWEKHRSEVDFDIVRYEGMLETPEEHLYWFLKYSIGVPREFCTELKIQQYVKACVIERMREEEDRNGGFFEDVRPVRSPLVREGKTHYWRKWTAENEQFARTWLMHLKGTCFEVML